MKEHGAAGVAGLVTRLRGGWAARKVWWAWALVLLALGQVSNVSAQTVTYFHTDPLGSVVAETDASGNVIKRYDYEPYGAVVGGQVTDGPGYTGHVSDAATGLSYMQQRYMDPQLGMFLSVDPVTAYDQPVGQFNRYRYANGNPYKFTDPDGRSATLAAPFVLIPIFVATGYYAMTTPQQREKAGEALIQGVKGLFQKNEAGGSDAAGAGDGGSSSPALPVDLVGDQSSPLAGPNRNGTRHTSGNLRPESGGTGNYDEDLKTLAGDTRPAVRGDSAPPGAQIGANGVFGRETNSSGGKSIDIPANGDKPHETLHYD